MRMRTLIQLFKRIRLNKSYIFALAPAEGGESYNNSLFYVPQGIAIKILSLFSIVLILTLGENIKTYNKNEFYV